MKFFEESEIKDSELFLIGTKKPRVLHMNKMVDDGKLKQTMLNETKLKRWKGNAYEKLSMWAYAATISFHKFSMC